MASHQRPFSGNPKATVYYPLELGQITSHINSLDEEKHVQQANISIRRQMKLLFNVTLFQMTLIQLCVSF